MNFLRKYILQISIFFVFLIIGLGVYAFSTFDKSNQNLSQQTKEKIEKLEGYERESEQAPSPYLVARLSRKKISAEAEYQALASHFQSFVSYRLPLKEIFPSLYYKEELYSIMDELRKRANLSGLTLPADLSIKEEGLPSAEQVPYLFSQLDTLKKLVDVAIQTEIPEISAINIGTPSPSGLYEEIPISLTIKSKSRDLAKFMEGLGRSQTIFILQSIAITGAGETVEAKMNINRIVSEERQITTKAQREDEENPDRK